MSALTASEEPLLVGVFVGVLIGGDVLVASQYILEKLYAPAELKRKDVEAHPLIGAPRPLRKGASSKRSSIQSLSSHRM
eukprot:6482063-Amphidinium_carterae.1